MDTLQGSWIWYELMTSDPEGAKAFYEPLVGWSMTTGHGTDMDYGFLTNPDGGMTGGLLRITEDMAANGARPAWLGYIGVDDCAAAVKAVEAAGGKLYMGPHEVPGAGIFAMVADCCGAPFYVMTPKPPEGSDGQSTAFSAMPRAGRCGWNELMAADAEKAIDFYTGLFGWSLPEPMDMGAMGKYQFIAHDGVTVGAIMPKPAEAPASQWNHYFHVASATEAKAQIEAGGGQVINGPMEVPGPMWIVQGIDPQGAFFCVVGGQ